MSSHFNQSPRLPFQVNDRPYTAGVNDQLQIFESPEKVSNTSFSSDNPLANTPALGVISPDKIVKPDKAYTSVPTVPPNKISKTIIKEFYGSSLIGMFLIIITYISTDIQKKPRAFKIGLFSIFIVVGFLVLMQSALQLSPLVFLKISENQIGDADLILFPIPLDNDSRIQDSSFNSNPLNSIRLLDGPYLEGLCDKMPELMGCSPRWILFGDAYNDNNEKLRVFVLAFDYEKEKSIGLGRNLIAPAISGNESYLTESTVKSLNLYDKVTLKMDVIGALISQGYLSTSNATVSGNQSNDEQIDEFKNTIRETLRNYLGVTGVNTSQSTTLNTSIIKENANKINDLIKNSNIPMDRSVSNYPGITKLVVQYLNLPSNFFDNFDYNLNNITSLLDSANNLPDNTTFESNSTVEALINAVIASLNLTSDFQIKANITSPNGKWTEALGNVLAFDYRFIPQIIVNSISEGLRVSTDPIINSLVPTPAVQNFIRNTIDSIDIRTLTVTENFVIRNRMNVYTDQTTINNYFIDITNKYFKLIGKDYPATSTIPLAYAVEGVLLIKSFLDNIFTSAVFILILLSMLLIYSLMLSNIDEKTYEFGMLRALGFKSSSLIVLLLFQGLIYAIPAMAFGFLFSFLVNGFVSFLLFDFAAEITSYSLHYTAIIIGFLLGILMPLISNILPIIRALSKTLRDSLDLYHRVVNIMAVRVMKLEKLGISFSQFINSFTLIIIGITTYYFAPLAFVRQDITLFLAIMNIVLIFLILGFTIFINLLQSPFEKLLLFLFIWGSDRKLKPLIHKNMKAHNKRNAKTALMFTICIAFLIFSGTGFNLQTNVIENSLKVQIGSDLSVEDETVGIDEYKLRGFIQSYIQQNPNNIDEYTFISAPFENMPGVDKPLFSPLSKYPTKNCRIIGIESNYLKTAYTKFYLPTEYDSSISYPELADGTKDGVYGLFTLKGTAPLSLNADPYSILSNTLIREVNLSTGLNETLLVIIPEGARSGLAIDTQTPGVMNFDDSRDYAVRVRNIARKVPGFGFAFSSYQTVLASKVTALMSMEQMSKLMYSEFKYSNDSAAIPVFFEKNPKNMTYDILKQKLLIKFKRALDPVERNELSNGLRNYFISDLTILFDTQSFIDTSEQAFYFINLFYVIVAIIAMILAFFLILVSFMSNVKENSWEFGVLRAIGINKYQMTRMYMYEAGVLTMAAGILGTIVGIVVAVTLIMQLLLFTELPFEFLFPTNIFCITFFLGFGTALGGSYYAVKEIRDKTIADITKGLL